VPRWRDNYAAILTQCCGCPMSRQAYMSLVCTSIRSAGAIGPACSTAMTCRACRGPTTSSKAASAIPVAACCGPRARRASPSARCNAKVPGSSYPGPQQRPSYWGPCVTLHLRTWLRKGSALLRIANGSACRADPFDRPKRNSITCVRGGRRDSLQAQGDFRGIAPYCLPYKVHPPQVQALLRMSTLMHVLSSALQIPPYRSILRKVWVYSHWQHINEC